MKTFKRRPPARTNGAKDTCTQASLGCMRRGSYSRKGMFVPSKCLLESPFSEPLLRTLLRTLQNLPFKATTRHLLSTLLKARAALKGTNLRGRTPICGFLRVPAVFCGFLRKNRRFPAKICVSPMLRFPGKGENQRKSARICENLRLGSVCPLRFVPLSAPFSEPSRQQSREPSKKPS